MVKKIRPGKAEAKPSPSGGKWNVVATESFCGFDS
jgi:hypothetical protein